MEYKKKQAQLNKFVTLLTYHNYDCVCVFIRLNRSVLAAQFCAPLCLNDKGTKDEVISRIMEFLLCPTDSGEVSHGHC